MDLDPPIGAGDRDHCARLTACAATPKDVWLQFEERFGVRIVEGYGLTETTGFCVTNPRDAVRVGSIVPRAPSVIVKDAYGNPVAGARVFFTVTAGRGAVWGGTQLSSETGVIVPVLRDRLAPGGTLAVITYHSGEDRVVKHVFREWSTDCICPPKQPVCTCGGRALGETLTRRAIRPREEEVARNPRARSAKLRAWKKNAQ